MIPVLERLGVLDTTDRGVVIPATVGFQILESFTPKNREAADEAFESDRANGGLDSPDAPDRYVCWDDLGDMDSADAAAAGLALYGAYALGASGDDPTPEEEEVEDDDGPPEPAPTSSA